MKQANRIAVSVALTTLSLTSTAASTRSCGANAVETGRIENNGQVTLSCECTANYVRRGAVCVPTPTGSAKGPSVRLVALEASGSVVVVLPDGTRIDPNSARTALLPAGTRFVTGPGARALLTFADGISLNVNENSVFAMEMPPGPQPYVFRLATGFINLLEHGPRRGRIRTPTVTVAVRGTEVSIRTDKAGGQVTLISGVVDLIDASGRVIITLKPRHTVNISADGSVGTPRAVQ